MGRLLSMDNDAEEGEGEVVGRIFDRPKTDAGAVMGFRFMFLLFFNVVRGRSVKDMSPLSYSQNCADFFATRLKGSGSN